MASTSSSQWINVSANTPCPICRRSDWCSVTRDGSLALCRREASPLANHGVDSGGVDYWIYNLKGESIDYSTRSIIVPPSDKRPARADAETLDKVYRAILGHLVLSRDHKQNLLVRGLSENEIERRLYRTWPKKGRAKIARAIAEKFGDEICSRIPGLYLKEDDADSSNRWWSLTGQAGLIIPVRNHKNQIVGLRDRVDEPRDGGKYRWISSANYEGASSGSPLHFPGTDAQISDLDEIDFTEGELKADIATVLSGRYTVSLPGVKNWVAAIQALKELGIRRVRLAFDEDFRTNPHVAEALYNFAGALLNNEVEVSIAIWNKSAGKGIDDVLAAGNTDAIDVKDDSSGDLLAFLKNNLEEIKANDPSSIDVRIQKAIDHLGTSAEFEKRSYSTEWLEGQKTLESLWLVRDFKGAHWINEYAPILKKRGAVKFVNKMIDKYIEEQQREQALLGGLSSNSDAPSDDANDDSLFKKYVEDAPVNGHYRLHPNWIVNQGGVSYQNAKIPENILPVPALVDHVLKDIATGDELISVRWKRNKTTTAWDQIIAPRASFANSRKIIDFATAGLPVNSCNAALASRYLSEIESTNSEEIPLNYVSSQCCWQKTDSGKLAGFLFGENYLRNSKIEDQKMIKYHPLEGGDNQLVSGLHARGSLEAWKDAVKLIEDKPKALLALFASIASPLLPLFNAPNFVVDFSGLTSQGKTSVLRLAASVWGNPDEMTPSTFLFTWDATRVWIERAAATFGNLPLILDDTKRAKFKNMIAQILYDFTSGHGKGRGSLKGVQTSLHWNSILLSTGEQQITDFSEDGGTHTRGFSIWCEKGPFDGTDSETGKLVIALNREVCLNYGHAGPAILQWLLDNQEEIAGLREIYEAAVEEFSNKSKDNSIASRTAKYFAMIRIGAVLAKRVLGIPQKFEFIDVSTVLWSQISQEASRGDRSIDALSDLYDWATSNKDAFYSRSGESQRTPSGGFIGRCDWKDDPDWEYIAFIPKRVKEFLDNAGYDSKSIVRIWVDKKWLEIDGVKRNTKNIRIGNTVSKMLYFSRETINSILEIEDNDSNLLRMEAF